MFLGSPETSCGDVPKACPCQPRPNPRLLKMGWALAEHPRFSHQGPCLDKDSIAFPWEEGALLEQGYSQLNPLEGK